MVVGVVCERLRGGKGGRARSARRRADEKTRGVSPLRSKHGPLPLPPRAITIAALKTARGEPSRNKVKKTKAKGRGRDAPPHWSSLFFAIYDVAHFCARRSAVHGSLQRHAGYLHGGDLQTLPGGVHGQPLHASYIWLSFHLPQIWLPATV